MKAFYTLILILLAGTAFGQSNLPACKGSDASKWNSCFGSWTFPNGDKYVGEYRDGKSNGQGTFYFLADNQFKGDKYVGEYKDGKPNGQGTYTFANGAKYVGEFKDFNKHGQGTFTFANGDKYVGESKDGKYNGQGTFTFTNGGKYVAEYVGEFKDGKYNGQGILTTAAGKRQEGIWEDNRFIREAKVNLPSLSTNTANNAERNDLELERQRLAEERRKLDAEKAQIAQAKPTQRISLQVNNTPPSAEGDVTINIQTNADTASLKINGEEQGGSRDGNYTIKRVARAGQETRFEIYAKDVYGNADTKTITVSRTVVESKVTYQQLNPDRIKRQPERDAVAIIIGISNYKSLPKAEFAKDDAQVFYDYAIRALGVKPGNIKLLMDEEADAEEIYTTFKTWLPARVKSSTDVYVFYSGHGLPTLDGSGLYWLPQRANRDVISKTAILLQDINSDIQASKPKSVTIFMDACYSGQARGGETLVASARPIALKSQPTTFPINFTVISASQADQISSSSPELQHGIFSYYLMRGMEGDADLNKDGKIILDEIQAYLSENVGRQARIMNRQQEPQVIGDGSRVLVGR